MPRGRMACAASHSTRRGKPVCFLVDQKTNEGIRSPFLFLAGCAATPAPAALAIKIGAVLQRFSPGRTGGAP